MKKLLALLLALLMGLSAVSALAEPAPAETEAVGLPEVGQVIHGFEALEIRPFAMIGAELVLFEHQKSGAKLLYVANDDTNRAFQLTFLTRPLDDTGLPHVFEHSTLSGSEKYPSQALFMNLTAQIYQTYMNAYTTDAMTSYPVGSLSEAQLLALADFYTDSCLHPNVLEKESIYRTEAWRYELADLDSPLTLNGTVYSEMTGALTLDRTAMDNANKVTFPGAALSYNYGGVPAHIPEMTWEDLKAYHDLFYHPGNCLALLYGSFEDYTAFLALLDEAFSPYDRAEISYRDDAYVRISEPVVTSVPYPVAAGTDTAAQSTVYYYIVCPGMKDDPAEEMAADHMATLLNNEASPLMQNLKKALPTGSFSLGREMAAPDDAFVFVASNVNETDAEIFRSTINDTLKEIAEHGFDAGLLDVILSQIRMENKLAREADSMIESVLTSLAYDYAVTGNAFSYPEQVEAMDRIESENEQGLFTKAITDWLLDPALYTLTTTYPAPGLKEEEDAALAASLAEVKAGMSQEELEAIVAATAAAPEEEDNSQMVASLTAVSVDTLPEEVKEYEISDVTGDDGIRRIDVTAGVDGVGFVELFLDARTLPQEDIHYLRLYTRLLGQLNTSAHTKEELSTLMNRYLHNRTFGVGVYAPEEDVQPWLVAEWYALDEDLETGYALAKELLYDTDFTDVQLLAERIGAQKAYARNQISSNSYQVQLHRALGADLPMNRYYAYLNFAEYYAFLEQVEAALAENPDTVIGKLQEVQSLLKNSAGAVSAFAGDAESIALNRPLADAFLASLDHEVREKPVYDLPAPAAREGLAVDTNTHFNALVASFDRLGLEANAGLSVVCTLLQDQVLTPVLRDQMGAYGGFCSVYDEDKGLYLISYRDPNLAPTFSLFDTLADRLEQMDISQEALNGYIMSNYSSLAAPAGELTGAANEIDRIISGKPADAALTAMRQLKSVTPETVKASAEIFRKLSENGLRSTSGGIGDLAANADLYDVILNPFGAADASQVALEDVAEDHPAYEAIRWAFEQNYMAAKEENRFAPDEGASIGDLTAAIYLYAGGGANAPEDSYAWLVGAGVLPAEGSPSDPLTFGQRDQLIMAVFGTSDANIATEENADTVMTRAELAQDIVFLFGE